MRRWTNPLFLAEEVLPHFLSLEVPPAPGRSKQNYKMQEYAVTGHLMNSFKLAGGRIFAALMQAMLLLIVIPASLGRAATATTTALAVSPSANVVAGTVQTLTATVGGGATGGTVYFCDSSTTTCDDAAILAQAQVTSAGTATAHLRLGPGTYPVKAVYLGTKSYAGSSSVAQTFTVTSSTTSSPALTLTDTSLAEGYTLTATMTSVGKIAPTGQISFVDTTANNAVLATQTPTLTSVSNSFGSATTYTTASQSSDGVHVVVTGDWNEDGIPDMAVADAGSNQVSIFLGKGDGTFAAAVNYTVGNNPYSIVAGDVNNDGHVDLVTANEGSATVSVLFGNGDGTFQSAVAYATNSVDSYPEGVALGDFNGDGYLDIAVADYRQYKTANVLVMLNNGDGTFASAVSYDAGDVWTEGISVADVNKDGIPDLIALNYGSGSSSSIAVLLGNGDGTFATRTKYITCSEYCGARSATVADLNGDGYPDVIAANWGDSNLGVLLNNGDGTFGSYVLYSTDPDPTSVAVGDVNGDGIPDLVIGTEYGTAVDVLPGKGDGTFGTMSSYTFVSSAYTARGNIGVALADLDADGILDLVSVVDDSSRMVIVPGQLSRVQTATVTDVMPTGTGTHLVDASYAGDSNYTAATSSTVSLNASMQLTTSTLTISPSSSVETGTAVTLTATLTPSVSGGVAATGSYSFYDGTTLLGTVPVTNGTAIYTSSAFLAGDHSLSAVYTGDTNFSASTTSTQTLTVTPPVIRSVLTITPSTATAGSAVTLTAKVTYGGTTLTSGTVNFCNTAWKSCVGPALLGSAQITSNGTASIVVRPGTGDYSLTANYLGSGIYSAIASSAQSLTITQSGKATTTTTMAVSGSVGAYTLTGTLVSTGKTAPPSDILFLDGSNENAELTSATPGTATTTSSLTSDGTYATGSTPVGVIATDLNGDGIPDLVLSDQGSSQISVLLGNGDGTYQTALNTSVGSGTSAITAGDFNNDGKPDLAVIGITDAVVHILLGSGDGTFTDSGTLVTTVTSSNDVAITSGDFNNDGNLDLAVVNGTSLSVYDGNGDGSFGVATTYELGGAGDGIVAGDFNSDGYLDLAVELNSTTGAVGVFLNSGDGNFGTMTSYTTGYSSSNSNYAAGNMLTAADLNNDGYLDLAMVNRSSNSTSGSSLSIFLGNGDGTFGSATTMHTYAVLNGANSGYWPMAVVATDLNGDGNMDLVTADRFNSYLSVFLGNGDGTVKSASIYSTGLSSGIEGLAVADLNSDSIPDLVVAGTASTNVGIELGGIVRTQAFSAGPLAQPGTGKHAVYAEYPGDESYYQSISSSVLLTGSSITPTVSLNASLNSTTYGQAATLTASLTPAKTDGYVPSGNVTFYDNGTSLGTVALANVQAALTTSALSVGSHSITASYAGDSIFAAADATAVNVQVAAATASISGTPVTTTYGTAAASTIIVSGTNTGTGVAVPSGTLSYSLDGAAAVQLPLVSGQASVPVSAGVTVGTHTLSLSYSGDTSYSAVSGATVSVTVNTATPTISWAAPTSIVYGTALSSAQLNAVATGVTGVVLDGSFTYSPAAGTVLSAGQHTITATFTPTDSTDYTTVTATVAITVTDSASTISWATPAAITYGTSLDATQLNATSTVDGTMTYSPGAGRVLSAGTHTLQVTFTPTDATDYKTATASVSLIVNSAPLTIAANSVSRTYGTANPTFTGTMTGVQGGDVLVESFSTSATASSISGSYTIVPSVTGSALSNYTVTAQNGVLTVTQATAVPTLSISASDVTAGTAVSFVASLPATSTSTPTGTVIFLDGTTTLGTASLNASGTAMYTTSSLAAGLHSISAFYSGDSDFASATTSAIALTVEDFSFTVSGGSQSIQSGGTATYTFTVASSGSSFGNPITFSVSGLPASYTATFSPATVTPGSSSTNVTLTVKKNSTSSALQKGSPLVLALLFLPLLGVKRFRKRFSMPVLLLVLALTGAAAATLSGCGGSGNRSQTYDLTITATSGNVQHTSTVTLTVE
jgi:hypothetical protein